jgi:hypothetical protein
MVNVCLAEETLPEVFVETDLCPAEYCRYGLDLTTSEDMDTFDRPNGTKIGTIKTGTKVLSVTGDLYSFPLQVVRSPRRGTTFENGKWVPAKEADYYAIENIDIAYGEKFFVIRYESEGYWKAWHKGKIVSVPEIWDSGKLGEPHNTWWVQLKTDNSKKVWVKVEPYYQKFYDAFKIND